MAKSAPSSVSPSQLELKDTQGTVHRIDEYRGKVVVVNFWATWCVPCKHEMPLFVGAEKKYGADKVQVLAVSMDDEQTRGKIEDFARKEKMEFPILIGDSAALKLLTQNEAVPATVFIDKDGKVVSRVLGEISKDELKARVEWMLGLKGGNPPAELVNNLNKKQDEGITPGH